MITPEPDVSDKESLVVEIVETLPHTPVPVKINKPCKKERIAPLDDPIQIISQQAGAKICHLGRRLSFGTIDSDANDVSVIPTKAPKATAEPSSATKDKRTRKPSEKAIAHQKMLLALNAIDNGSHVSDSTNFPETITAPVKNDKKKKITPKKVKKPLVESEAEEEDTTVKTPSKPPGSSKSNKSKGKQRATEPQDSSNEHTKPNRQTMPIEWAASNLNDMPESSVPIRQTQLPIMPAFAITVHKSQGNTLPRAVIDLQSCRGTESPYVMLSRVKSLSSVLILQPFDI